MPPSILQTYSMLSFGTALILNVLLTGSSSEHVFNDDTGRLHFCSPSSLCASALARDQGITTLQVIWSASADGAKGCPSVRTNLSSIAHCRTGGSKARWGNVSVARPGQTDLLALRPPYTMS
jgi:hypothetical protein